MIHLLTVCRCVLFCRQPSRVCAHGISPACDQRLLAEALRGHLHGYDRIIFCNGFGSQYTPNNPSNPSSSSSPSSPEICEGVFCESVRPEMDEGSKNRYPRLRPDYRSDNVPGLYFAGVLSHQRDYKRSAGGFIHGFRYTARALTRLLAHGLPPERPGSEKWASVGLTRSEFNHGGHLQERINSMPGPYQMFTELCDMMVCLAIITIITLITFMIILITLGICH